MDPKIINIWLKYQYVLWFIAHTLYILTHFIPQDCDEFTRNFLTKTGAKVPVAMSTEPADPYFVHRKNQAATMQPHRPYEKCDTLKQVEKTSIISAFSFLVFLSLFKSSALFVFLEISALSI